MYLLDRVFDRESNYVSIVSLGYLLCLSLSKELNPWSNGIMKKNNEWIASVILFDLVLKDVYQNYWRKIDLSHSCIFASGIIKSSIGTVYY